MSYQPWLDSINDILVPHIYNGLQVAYNSVAKICKGKKVIMAFQVTLENIKDLPQQSIDNDYKVLLKTSEKTEDELRRMFDNLYRSYANFALSSAGKDVSKLDYSLISPPKRISDFVKNAYVNTAREIWIRPFLFSTDCQPVEKQANTNEVFTIIKSSILKTVRDDLNLNNLTSILETGEGSITSSVRTTDTLAKRLRRIDTDTIMSESKLGVPTATLSIPIVDGNSVISKYNQFLQAPSEASDVRTVSDLASTTEYTIPSELEPSSEEEEEAEEESSEDTIMVAKSIADEGNTATLAEDDMATIYEDTEEEQENAPEPSLRSIRTDRTTATSKSRKSTRSTNNGIILKGEDEEGEEVEEGTIRNKSVSNRSKATTEGSTMNIKFMTSTRGTSTADPFSDLEINLLDTGDKMSSRLSALGL
jgi:hypothetical protein